MMKNIVCQKLIRRSGAAIIASIGTGVMVRDKGYGMVTVKTVGTVAVSVE